MMTFKEMYLHLEAVRRKNMNKHINGTYVSAKVSRASSKAIYDWVKSNSIPNAADPKQYHTTITYSRKGIPDVEQHAFDVPIAGQITGWKIFPTQNGSNCLVAVVQSLDLEDYHHTIQNEYGATYDYPDYIPHITVSYDYNGSIPKTVPDAKVVYDKVVVEPLDPEYISKVSDQ